MLIQNGIFFYGGFGTIIMKESLEKDYIFEGSGICFHLPNVDYDINNIITVPAGEYACMYKYGMPYEAEFLQSLIHWIEENDYKITGNIIDACLLDTTFYGRDKNVDFCQLQVPVGKIK
jgi:effector-binding domain-containing protein